MVIVLAMPSQNKGKAGWAAAHTDRDIRLPALAHLPFTGKRVWLGRADRNSISYSCWAAVRCGPPLCLVRLLDRDG